MIIFILIILLVFILIIFTIIRYRLAKIKKRNSEEILKQAETGLENLKNKLGQ